MGRPVSYYAEPDEAEPTYVVTKAREHSKRDMAGDLVGTNLSYAEVHDRNEFVRFWLADANDLKRHGLIIFNETVGYRIDTVLPDDGLTIDCEVVRAEEADLLGKSLADGTVIGA